MCDSNINAVESYTFKPFIFVQRRPKLTCHRPHAPLPRSGHRIVCDEKNLYSYGGYNPSIPSDNPVVFHDPVWLENGPLFKELWKFNYATGTWLRVINGGNVPNELASTAVVLNGPIMMVFGGTSVPFGHSSSNQLHICDLNRDSLCIAPLRVRGKRPPKQYGQAMILAGKYLYTIGGTSGYDYSSDIHRLDLQAKVWEEVYLCAGDSGDPQGRYRHELAFDGTRIYVLGGGTTTETFGFDKIAAFNLSTKKWDLLVTNGDPDAAPPGIPAARQCHGCVQVPDDDKQKSAVFICGGYNGVEIFADMWKLELKTLQWTCLSQCNLPTPLYFHSAALTPVGQMYVFGGISESQDELQRTSDLLSMWVCIPKLAEICWEAVLHYIPDLSSCHPKKLLKLGIPRKYVNRIA